MSFRAARLATTLAALVLVSGCAGPGAAPTPPASEPTQPIAASLPAPSTRGIDLEHVMRQVHFAYRPDGARWTAGHGTYTVLADARGATLTPYHWPSDARAPLAGAPVTFATDAVLRGAHPLSLEPARAHVESDGHLAIERGSVVEHLRNDEQGVEQGWAFAARPAGGGDLVVRVRVEGLAYARETAGGLHFVDAASGLGARYGVASWVDARGRRTEVRPHVVDGAVEIRVPASEVDAAAYPAVLDPYVSPEFGIDFPVTGPAQGNQISPAVSFNGTQYLAAWSDLRNPGQSYDIVATRVNVDGTVVDPVGFAIAYDQGSDGGASIASNGTDWYVVWGEGGGWQYVYGTRVTADGTVVTPGGTLLTDDLHATSPLVAASRTNYLVVFRDDRNNAAGEPWGQRVNFDGTRAGSNFRVAIPPVGGGPTGVASNGTDFYVAWQSASGTTVQDIFGTRVPAAAGVGATVTICNVADFQVNGTVASDGTEYYVVWQDNRNAATTAYDLYGARVTATNTVTPANGAPLIRAPNAQSVPALSWNGANYLLVWTDARTTSTTGDDVYAARLDATGTVLDPAGFVVASAPANQNEPAVASGANDWLVAWTDRRNTATVGSDIYSARVASGGGVLDPSPVNLTPLATNNQAAPALAWNGTDYLVVWRDSRNWLTTGDDLFAARIDAAGNILDPTGIAVCTTDGTQDTPAVTAVGSEYFVAWADGRNSATAGYELFGTRVGADGTVASPAGQPLVLQPGDQTSPALASDGTTAMLVWQDARALSTRSYDVFAARVALDGTVLDGTGVALPNTTVAQTTPAVAFNGTHYLVAWADARNSSTRGVDVYGARLTTAAAVVDTTPVAIATLAGNDGVPAVASNGTDFLVSWTTIFNPTTTPSYGIYGAHVSAAGAVAEPAGLVLSPAAATARTASTVAWDGSVYLVAWQDNRNAVTLYDILGVRVGPTGASLDATPIALAVDNGAEITPALASDGAGHLLLAYQRFDPTAAFEANRARLRLIGDVQGGVACARGQECSSGFCVDGVCCNTACGGGDPSDCMACSVAAGGTRNGTCTPATAGRTCRASAGACDLPEACDGTHTTCPADGFASAGTVCRAATGACDVAESCDGAGTACPADGFAAAGAECRPSAGPCDPAEWCDGAGAACPADALTPAGTVCRPAAGPCDAAETCDGLAVDCPSDAPAADGAACGDGLFCNGNEACLAGACVPGAPPSCDDGDPCTVNACAEPGTCSAVLIPGCCNSDFACDDGDPCTADRCDANACAHDPIAGCPPEMGDAGDASDDAADASDDTSGEAGDAAGDAAGDDVATDDVPGDDAAIDAEVDAAGDAAPSSDAADGAGPDATLADAGADGAVAPDAAADARPDAPRDSGRDVALADAPANADVPSADAPAGDASDDAVAPADGGTGARPGGCQCSTPGGVPSSRTSAFGILAFAGVLLAARRRREHQR